MAIELRNSKTKSPVVKGKKSLARKRARPGKTQSGDPYASGIPTEAEIEAMPTLLAGTGRGHPGCPTLKINPRKRPSYVEVVESESGAIRATVRGVDVTGILRFIGKTGYKWQVAATWLTAMAIPLRRNTIVSQVSAGSGFDPKRWGKDKQTLRGPIPDVDSATQSEIKRIARNDPEFEFETV